MPASPGDEVQAIEYRYPGAPKLAVVHPLMAIAPVAPALFYEERPKMTVWTLLANPTAIMMLVMAAMVFGLPLVSQPRLSSRHCAASRDVSTPAAYQEYGPC